MAIKKECIKEPINKPKFPPLHGLPRQVKTGESWESIARENGIPVGELIQFNCGTRDPREVNWCLEKLIGCVQTTADQNNYVFHSGAKPGIVYLPNKRAKITDDFLDKHGIIKREKWKARTGKIPDKPESYDWDYTTVVLHHSGRRGATNPNDVQNKHMDEKKFDDVGYHFMVDPSGRVYEGRKLYFKGSHVEQANTSKIGILVMGNFEKELLGLMGGTPSESHIRKVQELIGWLKELFPKIATLGGHKDWKSTECPGNQLYAMLPDIRKATGLAAP
jgi:hypothetical protein